MKTENKKFINHLGIKRQARKEQRKRKNGRGSKNRGQNVKVGAIKGLQKNKAGKAKVNGNKSKKKKPSIQQSSNNSLPPKADTGGFQMSASTNDRLLRLQEFVNRESGKSGNPTNKKTSTTSKAPPVDKVKTNLIKDKNKLKSLQLDIEDDERLIKMYANKIKLNKHQKEKVVDPIFAEDFGDILADIEEGGMSQTKESQYKEELRQSIFCASDSDFDSEDSDDDDLGDTRVRVKSNGTSSHQDSSNSDSNDDDLGDTRVKLKSNGTSSHQDSSNSDSNDDDLGDTHFKLKTNGTSSQQDYSNSDLENSSEDELTKETDNEPSDEDKENSNSEEDDDVSDVIDFDNEEESEEEGPPKGGGFFDFEADESSGEESLEEEPVHDDTKEHEYAFEAGGVSSKPDKLRNGMLNEIDMYSSDSGDDADLEGFIVDDDVLEYESDELGSPADGIGSTKKKRKRRRVMSTGSTEGESEIEARAHTDQSNDKQQCIQRINSDSEDESSAFSSHKLKSKRLRVVSESEKESICSSPIKRVIKTSESKANEDSNIKSQENHASASPLKKKKKKKKKGQPLVDKIDGGMMNGNDEIISPKKKKAELPMGEGNVFESKAIKNVPLNEETVKKKKKKKKKLNETEMTSSDGQDPSQSNITPSEPSSVKEDIYGRLVDSSGNVIQSSEPTTNGKYIPPALRKLMALSVSEKKKEQLLSLKRNLKGLINRLAESNMAGIASQIEGLYFRYSQNDLNDCLTQLLVESIVLPSLTPERLVQEHTMLIAVLSANVGNQVGAHILTDFVIKMHDEMQENSSDIECKKFDNMLQFIANLFNFRVVAARLIYDILHKLADKFREKEVELILLVLRTVGFSLRKEDPLALKTFISQIQLQAAQHEAKGSENYSRICFMLEVINSIKNNNPSKVPNYDPSHVEHLKKLMKGLVHKGKNLSPLYVTLNDILNSGSNGRWWIVGSAWSGGLKENQSPHDSLEPIKPKRAIVMEDDFSEHFRIKAAKLQLTRPPRINILYIVTEGSEDYLDAFDKLLQLKLPSNQEKEIFNVILLCCQKGKVYSEFYSYLACRMCKFDKKFKRLLQFAVWDKLGEIQNYKPRCVENIARFLLHLISEDALYVTVLKNLSFIDAEPQMINLVKIILNGLLLHPSGSERVMQIFSKITQQPELQVFCQSLRIFIAKFLISKKKKDKPKYKLLYERSQDVIELLNLRGGAYM